MMAAGTGKSGCHHLLICSPLARFPVISTREQREQNTGRFALTPPHPLGWGVLSKLRSTLTQTRAQSLALGSKQQKSGGENRRLFCIRRYSFLPSCASSCRTSHRQIA